MRFKISKTEVWAIAEWEEEKEGKDHLQYRDWGWAWVAALFNLMLLS